MYPKGLGSHFVNVATLGDVWYFISTFIVVFTFGILGASKQAWYPPCGFLWYARGYLIS